ncbi:recombinase family protein [Veillonella seminalis]|uniref:Resolvase/invertase-type recombinase catalytic domain-containing protein n=1 Tax=Veillonella seminalis ACS-216-V-Col6b TaxID=883156 RepID=K9CZI5_9FIRM|nr:recombinase family protein [Veillonella seminalis]EKU77408.1 hypothetical protein HMPREF9282_02125 [Veillonella seminalis ACS-216-V-Col6b]
MKIGYIRVSTKEQNIDRQKEELLKYGVEERYLFIDRASGKNIDRPEYQLLKRALRENDELFIHELDRLGRNKADILEELKYFKEKNIKVRILDVPTTLINYKEHGETAKIMLEMINNLLIEVFSTLAEAELKKIHKRQREGIQAAKEKGVKFGRPATPITDEFVKLYNEWKNKKITATAAMNTLKLKPMTFYRLVKRYEALKNK